MSDIEEAEDLNTKHRQLEKLHKNNRIIEEDLAKRQVAVQPWILVNMRVDMLLNAILGDDDRYDFEIAYAKNVHDVLMEIERQTADKKPGGLLLPDKSPLQLP